MAGKTVRKNRPEIKLNSYEDLFGEAPAHADTTEVLIKELHEFENHPFHVVDDDDMAELVQSICRLNMKIQTWRNSSPGARNGSALGAGLRWSNPTQEEGRSSAQISAAGRFGSLKAGTKT